MHDGISSCGRRPARTTPGRPSRRGRSGPSPTKVSVPCPCRANASARRTTFLRSVSEPTQRKRIGPSRRGHDREPVEVDAGADDLGLAARLGQLQLELAAQVLRDADHRRRTAHDEPRGGGDAAQLADVADVAAVRGHDERRPAGERGDEAARDEEVRVDDVGPRRAAACAAAARGSARLPPARLSSTASSSSWPRSRSASSTWRTNGPRSGAEGPGYSCETSRMRTLASLCRTR